MILLTLCLFIVRLVQSHSLNIDITSIHVVPDLYQLCWKQNASSKLDVLFDEKGNQFPVYSDKAKGDYHCITKRDISSTYAIKFPIEAYGQKITLTIPLKFYLPLAPPLEFIRKKIVSIGVYFQLHRDFAGISNKNSSIYCNGLISYSRKKSLIIESFKMDSSTSKTKFIEMDPGSTFNTYYSCSIPGWILSSSFMTNRGVVFPKEKSDELDPFIQYPFRRFLVSQWKHLKSYKKSYYIVISEVAESGEETCLKMFRSISLHELDHGNIWKIDVHGICDKDVFLEDIEPYIGHIDISAVLDMAHPLKANTKHKFTILYQNITSQVQDNFVYFETLSNENSGYISKSIYNYQSTFNNHFFRNVTSTMNQIVLSDFPNNPVEIASLENIRKYFEIQTRLSVTDGISRRINGSRVLSYNDLFKDCLGCAVSPRPCFYIILKKEMIFDKVEIISLPKKSNAVISKPQMTADPKTSTFTIQWNITNHPYAVTPDLFAIIIKKQESPSNCSFLHIIVCKTCNQAAGFSLKRRISTLTKWCKDFRIWKNHYDANDKLIKFTTPEMKPEVIFQADVIPFHMNNEGLITSSSAVYIRESFWRRIGYTLTISISPVIGLVVLILIIIVIGVSLKNWESTITKKEENEENKYYNEDEV